MSAKNKDNKNRWRCKTIAFRASPEEAYRLDMLVKTSGLTKQDYILKRLFSEEITVRPNIRVRKFFEDYLSELTHELKRLEIINSNTDVLDNIKYIVELIYKMTM